MTVQIIDTDAREGVSSLINLMQNLRGMQPQIRQHGRLKGHAHTYKLRSAYSHNVSKAAPMNERVSPIRGNDSQLKRF